MSATSAIWTLNQPPDSVAGMLRCAVFVALMGALASPRVASADMERARRLSAEVRRTADWRAAPGLARLIALSDQLPPDVARSLATAIVSTRRLDPDLKGAAVQWLAQLRARQGQIRAANKLLGDHGFVVDGFHVLGPVPGGVLDPRDPVAADESVPSTPDPVTWRDVGRLWPGGRLPLESLLSPGAIERAEALVRRDVWVDRSVDAIIRTSPGAADIAVNGFAAPAGAAALQRGWNRIVLRTRAPVRGEWSLAVRILDSRGRPVSSDRQLKATPRRLVAGRPARHTASPSFIDRWRAETSPLLAGARIRTLAAFGIRVDERVAGLPNSEDPAVLRDAAAVAERSDIALRLLRRLLTLQPDDVDAQVSLARRYHERGQSLTALDELRSTLASTPRHLGARLLRAEVLADVQALGAAQGHLVELARDFPRVPAVSQALASVFQRRQLPERALEQYTQLSQLDDLDGEALMWRLELNRGLGRADEARTLARALVERRPDVSGHRLALARLLEDLGDITGPAGADAVLNRAIAVFPRNADVTREGGAFLLRQGHEARGLARLHRSLVLRPHQPELRERLTYLERGKGGFEQDWRLDPRAVAAAVGPAKADGPDSEYLLTQRVTRLFKDGTTSTWTQHVYRLNRLPSGDRERAWSVLYDPSRQSVVVLNARRLRPGAPDVDAEQTDSALGEAWYGLYYEQRATTVSFADLEPGDVVVVEHRLADFGRSLYGRTFGDLFALQDREPRHRVRVAWIAPEDLNLGVRLLGGTDGTQAPPTKSVANGSRTVAWDLRDVPALEPEAGMPGYTQVGLYVHASTFDSWDAVAQWYRELVATQLEPSAAVTREAQTLTAGLTDPADKVAVLHQFVAQRIRYVGLEFGEHGYKPYSVAEILERRFGDCKDKASLLSTMLSVVGIKSELVLVRTRPQGRISEEATSPAVFDHAILYVPSLDTFLDATAGYNGMAELPIDDQGASALVVTPTGGRFISLPELSASANVLAREYDVQLRASETRMDGSMRASGAFAAPLRDILAVPASRREQFESMLVAEFPGIQLDGAVFDEVTALNKPVRLRFSGLLPSGDGAVRLLQPGLSLAGLAQTTSRRHPLRVAHPFVWRWSFHVHEEDGLRAVAPEPVAVKSAFGRATLTSRRSESGLDIDLEVAIEAHGVGIDKYPEFRRFILEAGSALSRAARLEVRREP